MKFYRADIEEIVHWVAMILFLFAVSYIAMGGNNFLVIIFAITYTVFGIVGLIQNAKEFLMDYYSKKKDI